MNGIQPRTDRGHFSLVADPPEPGSQRPDIAVAGSPVAAPAVYAQDPMVIEQKAQRRTAWAARFVAFAGFIDLFAQFPVVGPFALGLGASPALVGVIVAAYSFSNLFGNLAAGPILDRWGRKRSIITGLLAAAGSLVLYSVVRSPEALVGVRILHGLAAAVLSPGAFALLGDAAPPGRRARAMGSAGAFIALAAVIGPALAGIGRDRFGPETVFLSVAGILTLTALIVGVAARELPPADAPSDRRVETGFFRRPSLLTAYGSVLALTIGIGTLVTHLPIMLQAWGEGARASGTAFSIYALVGLVGMAGPAARLADRYGRIRPLVAGLAIIGLGLGGLAIAPNLNAVYGSLAVFGAGFALLFPAATALVADGARPTERGAAYGVFYAVYSGGTVIGSLLSGEIAEQLGLTTTIPFLVGSLVAISVAATIAVSRRNG